MIFCGDAIENYFQHLEPRYGYCMFEIWYKTWGVSIVFIVCSHSEISSLLDSVVILKTISFILLPKLTPRILHCQSSISFVFCFLTQRLFLDLLKESTCISLADSNGFNDQLSISIANTNLDAQGHNLDQSAFSGINEKLKNLIALNSQSSTFDVQAKQFIRALERIWCF